MSLILKHFGTMRLSYINIRVSIPLCVCFTSLWAYQQIVVVDAVSSDSADHLSGATLIKAALTVPSIAMGTTCAALEAGCNPDLCVGNWSEILLSRKAFRTPTQTVFEDLLKTEHLQIAWIGSHNYCREAHNFTY